jgi:3-phenylpropionate/cinnamic acid dioxygenase small subunit
LDEKCHVMESVGTADHRRRVLLDEFDHHVTPLAVGGGVIERGVGATNPRRREFDVLGDDEGPGPRSLSEPGRNIAQFRFGGHRVGDLHRGSEGVRHEYSLAQFRSDYLDGMSANPVPYGFQSLDGIDDPSRLRQDRQAIVDLTIRYTWALDTRHWDDLDEVFLPEATAHLTEDLTGRDAIKQRIRRALEPLDASQHMISNHQVVVDGDRASCRCYLQAQHVRHAAPGSPNFIVAGRYEDQLVRTSHGWRIAHRALVIMWTDGNPSVARG